MKKKKKQIKMFPSLFILIGTVLLALSGYAIGIFCLVDPVARSQEDIFMWCLLGFFCGLLPTLIIVGGVYRGYYSIIAEKPKKDKPENTNAE